MKYEKPVCDCGEELIYEVDIIFENVQYKINKDGSVAKSPLTKITGSGTQANFGRLVCNSCGNMYEADMKLDGKDKGKILRDDKM